MKRLIWRVDKEEKGVKKSVKKNKCSKKFVFS
jgi:hypothetical protein